LLPTYQTVMKVLKAHWLPLAILLVSSIALSLSGGEPFHHPDDILPQMVTVLQNNGNPYDGSHTDFQYPGGLVIYIGGLVYGFLYLFLKLSGGIQSTDDFKQLYQENTLPLFANHFYFSFPGHLVIVFFSILGAIATYFTVYKLTHQKSIAFASGLFLSTSFLWVINSHFVTVDVPMISLNILTILLCLHFIQEKQFLTFKQLVWLGVALGLTASTKWSGVLIATSITTAVIFSYLSTKKPLPNLAFLLAKHFLILFVTAGIVCLATNPYLLPNFNSFLADVNRIMGDSKGGWYGHYTENAMLFHLQNSLYSGYGFIPLILAIIGFVGICTARSITTTHKLLLTVFPVFFYLSVGRSHMSFYRYILPIFPFLAVYSAYGCFWLYQVIRTRFRVSLIFLTTLLLAFAIAPNVVYSAAHNSILAKRDMRQDLITVMNNMDTQGRQINVYAGGYLAPYVKDSKLPVAQLITAPASRSGKSIAKGYEKMRLMGDRMDMLVFDSFSHDPLIYSDRDFWIEQPYQNISAFQVIQITPFSKPKEQVPFAPESSYSPALPDLFFRNQPGPFIEIYLRDQQLAKETLNFCIQQQIQCVSVTGENSYYLKQINQKVARLSQQTGRPK
jgi:hypothetical protein